MNVVSRAKATQGWSIEDSMDLYSVPSWGGGYFHVNAAGHVVVRPDSVQTAAANRLQTPRSPGGVA